MENKYYDGKNWLNVYFGKYKTEYKFNGVFHRIDGPAIEYANGDKLWYINGKRHREDGPAAEYTSGTKEWYINGKLHREDGPAIEWVDGSKEWWLNGEKYNVNSVEELMIANIIT